MNDVIPYFFIGITIISACLTALSKQVIHAAFASLVTVFGVSGLFICIGADFLGITLLFIYISIVLLLVLFIVFLTPRSIDISFRSTSNQLLLGTVVSLLMMGLMVFIGYHTIWIKPANSLTNTVTEQLGHSLMTEFSLPFEIGSLILFAAMIGAITIARRAS